jgi:hypothetical protein
MSKFSEATVKAVGFCRDGICSNPAEAWEKAVVEVGFTETSQEKGCPKSAFLGICEEELVKGIEPGSYTDSEKNKNYGLTAIRLLKGTSGLARNASKLWKAVLEELSEDISKTHNSQMDVVIALWENNLLN